MLEKGYVNISFDKIKKSILYDFLKDLNMANRLDYILEFFEITQFKIDKNNQHFAYKIFE